MRKVMVIAAAAVLLGCGDQVAKDAVKGLLNDPGSAQFSGMQPGKSPGDYCGFVNAKNRMGGYVGNTPFYYVASSKTVGIAKAPEDSDFRSLWLAIKLGSDFGKELGELATKCGNMTTWEHVCTFPHPEQQHRLCPIVQGSGSDIYPKLAAEFGR